MFYSAKEFLPFAQNPRIGRTVMSVADSDKVNLASVRKYLRICKKAIVAREHRALGHRHDSYRAPIHEYCLTKWYRPWEVVPKWKEFSSPVGDYGIGVEVEMGFVSLEAASTIVASIQNWKHIAVDVEGGANPIEATFPPFLYSKLSSRVQPMRYLSLLRKNEDLVYKHSNDRMVGIHINVSKGGVRFSHNRINALCNLLEDLFSSDSEYGDGRDYDERADKYFGRKPYGYAYDQGKYIEFKLFNSTTCGKALRRYINIAVSLTDLIASNETINEDSVLAALEAGYSK